jgi:hypothetical protein
MDEIGSAATARSNDLVEWSRLQAELDDMTKKEAKVRAQAVEAVAVLTEKLTYVKESEAIWRVRAAELEVQLQNTQDELKKERALSKVVQDAEMNADHQSARDLIESLKLEVEELKNKVTVCPASFTNSVFDSIEQLSANQASAGDSKKDGEYAKLLKKHSNLKQWKDKVAFEGLR